MDKSQSVGRKKVFIITGGIVVVVAVVLIVFLIGLLRLPWWNAAPSLPKDLVLESNARKSYFKDGTIQLTQFTTSKSLTELKDIYADKLSASGWRIIGQGTSSDVPDMYTIVAVQSLEGLKLNIFIQPLSKSGSPSSNSVSLSIRHQ